MQDIFLSEEIRSKYFQTLVGCDLGGMPVRFMTSYWCAVLLSYSPGCMELSVPTAPLCAETCNDFTASLSKLVSDTSTCDPQAVKAAMSALSANISQSSSSANSPSFSTGIPIPTPTPTSTSLNNSTTDPQGFNIDPAWLCSSRLLSGSNLTSTTGCISGQSREPYCGWLDHDAACRNGCATEDCPAVPTPRQRSPGWRPEAVGSSVLDPMGWVGLVVYLGIAVGACGLSAGAVMAGMWVWKRGETRKRRQSEIGVGTEAGCRGTIRGT
ncbi:hypothetical protein BCR44DRAFT_1295009 [Catenaria anguillulae PL171]|uniref:Uncharacterized protein n=1 Tax=Catenaria anguillulae PL171 TaxID=765915 RepID=A0A1Y2HVA9_9FUNG|nr:hypothetical protein BCR44DRAFT_1295009 [Catenaria anguillulae PL171]